MSYTGPVAKCTKCSNVAFIISEHGVRCLGCGKRYDFSFLDDSKSICETKANDIVILINEGY